MARIEIPRSTIAEFCHRHGLARLSLFGSVLGERFGATSDIDVLVDFQPGREVGFLRLAQMEEELSRILSGRRVELRTPADRSRHFRDEVLREAETIFATG